MSTWFLVFLMAQGPGENFTEFYKIQTEFGSMQECVEYVKNPLTNQIVRDHLLTVYPIRPVENVWCMTEKDWIKITEGGK